MFNMPLPRRPTGRRLQFTFPLAESEVDWAAKAQEREAAAAGLAWAVTVDLA